MRLKTLFIAFTFLLLFDSAVLGQQQQEPNTPANHIITELAKKLEACPATEQVTQFQEKWVKVAWGPLTSVHFKVDKPNTATSSSGAVIEFSIPYSNSEHRDTRADAESERNLNHLFISPVRYELEVAKDGTISVKSMKIQNSFSGKWDDYAPKAPERFCWLNAVAKPTQ